MGVLQTPLMRICESGHQSGQGMARTLVTLLVALCLTIQAAGVSVTVSTLIRLETEGCAEESKCEVEGREASHKCSRLCLATFLVDGRSVCQHLSLADAGRLTLRPLVPTQATHLVGAGITLRC